MAVISVTLEKGPNVQADGRRRGHFLITLDDRVIRRHIETPDATAWDDLVAPAGLAALGDKEQARAEKQDAQQGADDDSPVSPGGQAGVWKKAVAKIQRANQTGKPLKAFRLMDRVFEELRTNQGIGQDQVETRLLNNGLAQEEYDFAFPRWIELRKNGNQNRMNNYETLLANDVWGEDLRGPS